ncbi:hypothetical protein AXG93_3825s1040 [Marchantia polymorpha subsp. ruderalis]|uniref:Uncharacterized protein n=1 Tax=Marchantia polymorpha subsp. ruderalis TaxID=1480154 RepID=A0A176W8A0_MARPO|nr:hypothetical protein AXG93_3825s1040 [Marchantia polymorpha subsp. ruderalis]
MLILRIGLDISGRTCCCEGDGEGDEEGDGDGEGEEEEEASVRIDSVMTMLMDSVAIRLSRSNITFCDLRTPMVVVMMPIDVAAGDQAFGLPPALVENHTTDSDTLQPRRADKNIFGFSL